MRVFSKAQTQAFRTFGEELSVLAGAGSGKTSVLVERFLTAVTEKGISPGRILAITFTEKAANQMKMRLIDACRERGLHELRRQIEGAYISTIHGFCARLLKENPIESGLDPFFRVLGEGEADIFSGKILDTLFEEEARNARWVEILSQIGEEAARDSIRKMADLFRATGGDESIFRLAGTPEEKDRKKEFVRVVRRFQVMFDAEKRRLSCYDFDDLLFLAYKLLSDKAPAQAGVRSRIQKLFSLVLVDEYQDVSSLQDALIDLLRSDGNLFIVGDIQQSIYGFRHAEPEVFRRRIRSHQDQAAAKNIVLSENYRSRPEILGFVNQFFRNIFPESDFFALEAGKRFTSSRDIAVEVLCLARDKKEDDADADTMRVREARCLSSWIEEQIVSGSMIEEDGRSRPVRYGDIALLLRASGPSRFYEQELLERNIPFHVVKGKGFFEKPEIADLMGLLKLIEDPEDDIALAGVLRSPLVAISDDALYWLSRRAKSRSSEEPLVRGLDAFQAIEQLSSEDREKIGRFSTLLGSLRDGKDELRLAGILDRALEQSDYEAKLLSCPGGRQRVANVRKLIETADTFSSSGVINVGDFVRFIGTLSERDRLEPEAKLEGGTRNAVTISTIHAVKGLEFPIVIVADMGARRQAKSHGPFAAMPGEGLGQRTKDPETFKPVDDETYKIILERTAVREEAEGWRLLYVAMTRAKEHLLLSGSVSLSAKDGEFKKDGTWMNCLCAAIGHHPARGSAAMLDVQGIKVGIVSAAPPVSAKKIDHEVQNTPSQWPEGLAASIDRRLHAKFKSYDETEDRTVSDLLAAAGGKEAKRKIIEDRDTDDQSQEGEWVTSANEFGTIFHRLMEYLALARPAKISLRGLFSRVASPLSEVERKKLWDQASVFWNSPWGRQVRQARRIYPELPFLYKTPYGLLKGQIDLVFQQANGDWVILDYKTHKIVKAEKEATANQYAFQLALYVLVFKKLYGEAPKTGVLYFSSLGEDWQTAYSEADYVATEKKLDLAFERVIKW